MSKRDHKRCFLERAGRAPAGKRSRSEADRSPDTTSLQAPGLSSSLATVALIQADHHVPAECSDSELSSSDCPSSDKPFCEERMQVVVDDFMVSLPSVERKILAVLLIHSVKVRQNMKVTDAARE